jgi:hypothetical protein
MRKERISMKEIVLEPVLVVCAESEQALQILGKLFDDGVSVVGPAPTAGLALTLAAQTMPRMAILAGETAGRRSSQELAEELSSTWGVNCFTLSDGVLGDAQPSPAGT